MAHSKSQNQKAPEPQPSQHPPQKRATVSEADALPQLAVECLDALTAAGLPATWRWRSRKGGGVLELRIAGARLLTTIAARPALAEAHLGTLRLLAQQAETRGERLLVCTRRATSATRENVRRLGACYIDIAGNASLEAPGIHVQIAGRAPAKQPAIRARLAGTDLRLLHILIRDGGTASRTQRELAEQSGVALGAVGKGLRNLEAHGLLRARGPMIRDVVDLLRAQAEFAEGWATVLRRKLAARSYRHVDPARESRLLAGIAKLGDDCLLGGELAAARTTDELQTRGATLHVRAGERGRVVRELGLVPDDRGAIIIVDRFGQGDGIQDDRQRGLLLAHPLLVHAELVAIGDERLSAARDAVWGRWMEGRSAR